LKAADTVATTGVTVTKDVVRGALQAAEEVGTGIDQ
jgi:hypothetical protein